MRATDHTSYSDLWADVQPETSRRMLLAAVDAFAVRGYEATTTREIAQRCGMSPAAVYVHYKSKADLLFEISRVGSQSWADAVERAMDGADAPTDRLHRLVAASVAWHADNRTLARVIQYEVEALPVEQLDVVQSIRDRVEQALNRELRRGAKSGDFDIADRKTTMMAILSMGIDVARWYRPGRPSPEKLGSLYADLALRMVGATSQAAHASASG